MGYCYESVINTSYENTNKGLKQFSIKCESHMQQDMIGDILSLLAFIEVQFYNYH